MSARSSCGPLPRRKASQKPGDSGCCTSRIVAGRCPVASQSMSPTPRRRATLASLAAELKVSRTTISNAYNRPDQLSAALRERVLATAKRLGYAGLFIDFGLDLEWVFRRVWVAMVIVGLY